MKKFCGILIIMCLTVSLCACGTDKASTALETATNAEESIKATVETEAESESETEDSLQQEMDELSAIGDVEVNNGILTVSVTLPSDFISEDMTQEKLDSDAGKKYMSAKLNEDGSVTYKLTKSQHREMLDGIIESIDGAIQEMVEGDDNSFEGIKHNVDYSVFDVQCSGSDLNLYDSFSTFAFYIYGGLYQNFAGVKDKHVIVNYYDPDGNLISSADSDNLD